MSQPSVSVLIPAYNHERFVAEAIRSARDQLGAGDEILVLDDGSSDGTLAAAREVAAGDDRVLVDAQANAGAHEALNRLLDRARGRHVAILNSDDRFPAGRLQQLIAALDRRPDASLATSWIRIIDDGGAAIGAKRAWHDAPPWPSRRPGRDLHATGDSAAALLQTNWIATTSNLVLRRETVAGHGLRFMPLRYAHDWDFMLQLVAHGPAVVVEKELVDYRVHGRNTIREGGDADAGEALMRFEIAWVLARHAAARCADGDLMARFVASRPPFLSASSLHQLLMVRGQAARCPASYDALLEPTHPLRRRIQAAMMTDGSISGSGQPSSASPSR
jgi:glycosyltransferase involved in cell wall biosynthesis